MAVNDVYLRQDAGDGTNGVRLRPDAPDAGGITGTLAATEAQDVALLAGVLGHVGTLAATEAQDTASIAGTVTSGAGVTGTLAATEAQDVAAFSGTSTSAYAPPLGGVPIAWDNARGLTPALRAKLRQMWEDAEAPVREAIAAQAAATRQASEEAEERALQAAIQAARMEYHELYLRLLAYQREELRLEEEAVCMTMILALSR